MDTGGPMDGLTARPHGLSVAEGCRSNIPVRPLPDYWFAIPASLAPPIQGGLSNSFQGMSVIH
jgi:hypothetical protein